MEPFKPEDFMPFVHSDAKRTKAEEQSPGERMLATVEAWNLALGGRDLR